MREEGGRMRDEGGTKTTMHPLSFSSFLLPPSSLIPSSLHYISPASLILAGAGAGPVGSGRFVLADRGAGRCDGREQRRGRADVLTAGDIVAVVVVGRLALAELDEVIDRGRR